MLLTSVLYLFPTSASAACDPLTMCCDSDATNYNQTLPCVSYRVSNGTSKEITAFSICKVVLNNAGWDLFVPVKTLSEWSYLYTNGSPNVTISECVPTGTPVDTPVSTPNSTPVSTPVSTPTSTVSPTPDPTPVSSPVSTPVTTPDPTPVSTPTSTPAPTPDPTPVSTPTSTPAPTPDPTPSNTPSSTPEPTPSGTPDPTPQSTPNPTPESTPEPTPEPTPISTPVSTPTGGGGGGNCVDTEVCIDWTFTFYCIEGSGDCDSNGCSCSKMECTYNPAYNNSGEYIGDVISGCTVIGTDSGFSATCNQYDMQCL